MYSGTGDTTQLVPGYPIRTPWDHSSVDSSPRPIAASHVLHRLLVPRHPHVRPYTLDHKQDARIHYTILNTQPTPPHTAPPTPTTAQTPQQTGMEPAAARNQENTHPQAPVPSEPRQGAPNQYRTKTRPDRQPNAACKDSLERR
jgi:hypothetical protein